MPLGSRQPHKCNLDADERNKSDNFFQSSDCPLKRVWLIGMLMRMPMSAQCDVIRVRMFVRSVDRVYMVVAMLGLRHERFGRRVD